MIDQCRRLYYALVIDINQFTEPLPSLCKQYAYFIVGIQRQVTIKLHILIFWLEHCSPIHVPRYHSIVFPWYYGAPLNATALPSHWLLLFSHKYSSGSMPRANSTPGDPGIGMISSSIVPKSRPRDETEVQREVKALYWTSAHTLH